MVGKVYGLLRSFVRQASRRQASIIIIAGIIGVVSGIAAILFEEFIDYCSYIFYTIPHDKLYTDNFKYLLIIITPALGGFIVGFLQWYTGMSKESASIADLMKWAAVDSGIVKKRVVFVRSIASAIFLGSGGSGGREGPIAQIAGAIASVVGQFLKISTERLRLLVGCGSAAGIAAAFNAPIAGVIFAVELILADYNVGSFLPIVISSVMATTVKRMIVGDIPVFSSPAYTLASPYEIFLYLLLGVMCGLAGWLFYKVYFLSEDFFKYKMKIHPAISPAIGGLVVGLIGVWFPEIFGNGYDTMSMMLDGKLLIGTAFLLIFLKIIATGCALGSGGSGGIFAPSLFIGCMTGGVFGHLVNMVAPFDVASAGAYAMVGLGAVMAAVAHAPLTNILMVYELTGNYQIILPIMTACIMSTYIMMRFTSESLYTEKLRRRGIKLWRGRDISVMDRKKVKDVMSTEFVAIKENAPFSEILDLITKSQDNYFPMVDSQDKLQGIISVQNIRAVLNESVDLLDIVVAKDIASSKPVFLREDNNLNDAFISFTELDVEQLPVVSEFDTAKVVGIISRRDAILSYNKDILLGTSH